MEGKFSNPEVIVLTPKQFDALDAILAKAETEEPSPALVALMARKNGKTYKGAAEQLSPVPKLMGFCGHKADILIFDDVEQVAKLARKFPSVGDTIAILHCVKRNSAGEVLGVHRADAIKVDTISAVYLDGTVRTGLGDVWEVQAASGESKATKGAKWATINPMHGKGSN